MYNSYIFSFNVSASINNETSRACFGLIALQWHGKLAARIVCQFRKCIDQAVRTNEQYRIRRLHNFEHSDRSAFVKDVNHISPILGQIFEAFRN